MSHTPGPWFVFSNTHCVGGPHADPNQPTAGVAMCALQFRRPDEIRANTRLIAAAPDMLEELKGCESFLSSATISGVLGEVAVVLLRSVRAVIAKAEALAEKAEDR